MQPSESEGYGRINVMNTCHPGKQKERLNKILKFKIRVKLSTTAYA